MLAKLAIYNVQLVCYHISPFHHQSTYMYMYMYDITHTNPVALPIEKTNKLGSGQLMWCATQM